MLRCERAIIAAMIFSAKANGRRVPQLLAVHLLVVMVALRALIPAGFMPDFAAAQGGTFQLVLCTQAGLKIVTVDAKGEPTDPAPAPVVNHELCAFAAPAGGLEVSLSALVVAWRGTVELVLSDTVDQRLAGPARWNGHGARAPPMRSVPLIPITI